jgi:hypothetical protein
MRSSCAWRPAGTEGGRAHSSSGTWSGNGLGGSGGRANVRLAGHRTSTSPAGRGHLWGRREWGGVD